MAIKTSYPIIDQTKVVRRLDQHWNLGSNDQAYSERKFELLLLFLVLLFPILFNFS